MGLWARHLPPPHTTPQPLQGPRHTAATADTSRNALPNPCLGESLGWRGGAPLLTVVLTTECVAQLCDFI